MAHGHGHAHGNHHQHVDDADAPAMAELLDLDAEVLHEYVTELMNWITVVADSPVQRILDVGCGTGTGTFALAQTFPAASVVSIDLSQPFLDHLAGRARELGLADRVSTVHADLDATWPALEPADLVWASTSMHHMSDPDRVLGDVLKTLRPGGTFVLVELDSFPRFLPDDIGLGTPGLEVRCREVMAAQASAEMPTLGSDWGPRLSGAGFTVEAEREIAIDVQAPLPAATPRYIEGWLRRLRSGLEKISSAEDLATVDALLDADGPHSVLRRADLTVRGSRSVWIARRPLS